ncbi:stringent starvation protein B [Enterobacter cloacae]|uniref:Stringent starvation protein B n=1 Tax=Enterobacter cloacae TaxID=550 RepID=A0A377LSS6_ENTCL|nr:stringent starvation protein B [Enterobacter cloacae]
MEMSQLSPRRPYLLRAFYEWLLDNQLTPHLVVDVTLPGVLVPMEYARDGQIVLNIAPVRWVILNWRTTKCVLTRVSAAYRVRFPCRWRGAGYLRAGKRRGYDVRAGSGLR